MCAAVFVFNERAKIRRYILAGLLGGPAVLVPTVSDDIRHSFGPACLRRRQQPPPAMLDAKIRRPVLTVPSPRTDAPHADRAVILGGGGVAHFVQPDRLTQARTPDKLTGALERGGKLFPEARRRPVLAGVRKQLPRRPPGPASLLLVL